MKRCEPQIFNFDEWVGTKTEQEGFEPAVPLPFVPYTRFISFHNRTNPRLLGEQTYYHLHS